MLIHSHSFSFIRTCESVIRNVVGIPFTPALRYITRSSSFRSSTVNFEVTFNCVTSYLERKGAWDKSGDGGRDRGGVREGGEREGGGVREGGGREGEHGGKRDREKIKTASPVREVA